MPPGEVASDAPTDVELDRSADAARRTTEAQGAAAAPVAAEPRRPNRWPRSRNRRPSSNPPPTGPDWERPGASLSGYLGAIRAKGKVDAATWDDLEEALIRADVGVGATDALLDDLRTRVKSGEIGSPMRWSTP